MKLTKNEIVPFRISEVSVYESVTGRIVIDVYWKTHAFTVDELKQYVKDQLHEVN